MVVPLPNTTAVPLEVMFPAIAKDPVINTLPVNVWELPNKFPKIFDPLEYTILEVTVCTFIVCAIIVPVVVKLPDCNTEPEIVWVPIKVFEPVVAKLLVLLFKDDVYVNTLALNEFSDDVNKFWDAVNEFTLALNEFRDDVNAVNELVSVNTVASSPSNRSALAAYDADAIEPDSVMLPEAIILPVTVSEPEMYGELIIIFLFIF